MAGLAADRKGGRPPTQALPRQARCLFGSDSTEWSANFLFRRVFFTRTGIHPGSSPGQAFAGKRYARFAQTGRMRQ
jgi:hypothetical protein